MEQKIRNFAIISHIDHGKSTLADRFLEFTSTIEAKKMRPQFLDMMDLERERGITIKLQPVRMEYKGYILNMIDTPGHVDFSYEVSRSLAAIEGALLLVDVSKGIQAQTLANLEMAKEQGLKIIPIINKVDLMDREQGSLSIDQDRASEVAQEVSGLLNINPEEILRISAKTGLNVDKVLEQIISNVPAPKEKKDEPLRALIFDFQYDSYLGVIAFIRVIDGELKKDDKLYLLNSKTKAQAKEVGYFKPQRQSKSILERGEIGYVVLGIKEPEKVKIGDTIVNIEEKVEPLPGYKEPRPVVFMGLFPENPNNWGLLKEALSRFKLNDPSLTFRQESKMSLGQGFQCGFLGLLHAEIVIERLKREFNLELITSAPSVGYRIIDQKDKVNIICSAADWPDGSRIKKTQEQICEFKIIVPQNYLGQALELLVNKSPEIRHLSRDKKLLVCEIPFREIMDNFYDKLKSATKGFGSMEYKIVRWEDSHLAKLEILVLGELREAFSSIVPKDSAYEKAKAILEKLLSIFPPQLFDVPLQARIGGTIISRKTVRARRKDVTGALYGGDYTRKRKLLEQQKKGKEKLKQRAKIKIPQEVFWKLYK
ncbi:translation elongation factor 4 [Patescibacteria group bacterium]|nr:translation elongation factor 4 [Patescibacteria group bacterium]